MAQYLYNLSDIVIYLCDHGYEPSQWLSVYMILVVVLHDLCDQLMSQASGDLAICDLCNQVLSLSG